MTLHCALPCLLALAVSATASDKEPFGMMTVDQVAAQQGRSGVYLFDANRKDVFDAGHLPGAKFVPPRVEASDLPADKNATLIFYCKNPH